MNKLSMNSLQNETSSRTQYLRGCLTSKATPPPTRQECPGNDPGEDDCGGKGDGEMWFGSDGYR